MEREGRVAEMSRWFNKIIAWVLCHIFNTHEFDDLGEWNPDFPMDIRCKDCGLKFDDYNKWWD